jgi:hypothetical protein
LQCAFSSLLVSFHLFPGKCPAKHISPKTSGARLKYMHMCQKFVNFSCFGS